MAYQAVPGDQPLHAHFLQQTAEAALAQADESLPRTLVTTKALNAEQVYGKAALICTCGN
jgi:hypothetical protein